MTAALHPIRLYHIVHIDRLESILADGFLWSDAVTRDRGSPGTVVGMASIKERRLRTPLTSHPDLRVGDCVPFHLCPKSVMLYLLHRGNREGVTYRGGQEPIVHLVADLHQAAAWAEAEGLRWAFTLSNAGSAYFEDRCDLARLDEIDWDAVRATRWAGPGISEDIIQKKQAEFLVENRFPWTQVIGVGVHSKRHGDDATRLITTQTHKPRIEILPQWYY